MRRNSAGSKAAPDIKPPNDVLLRNKPIIGPGFMRRSCTFVTEGGWRSSFGIGSGAKEAKDRANNALKGRQTSEKLSAKEEDELYDEPCDLRDVRPGRVSRLVGNLKSWSSSEDVRQSVVGAFTRKLRPTNKKLKDGSKCTTVSHPPIRPNIPKSNRRVKEPSKSDPKSLKLLDSRKSNGVPIKPYVKPGTKKPHDNRPPNKTGPKKRDVPDSKRWIKHLSNGSADNKSTGNPATNVDDAAEISIQYKDEEETSESPQKETDLVKETTLPPYQGQAPGVPFSIVKKSELLRRKDAKISRELEEKQNLVADILNIPREDFESVADMATEVGLASKEPRELVLGAIFQAKRLQETLNEAQNIKDTDVITSQIVSDRSSRNPEVPALYPVPMDKLLNITGSLTQFLNSLLTLVSERDDERERMRKELVASRDRSHQRHKQDNQRANTDSTTETSDSKSPPARIASVDGSTPHSSRPNSYISVGSSGTETAEPLVEQSKDDDSVTDKVDAAQDKNCDVASTIEEEETDGDTLSLKETVEAS